MFFRLGKPLHTLCLIAVLVPVAGALALSSWRGVLRDDAGKPVGAATVKLTVEPPETATTQPALRPTASSPSLKSLPETTNFRWKAPARPGARRSPSCHCRTAPRSPARCNLSSQAAEVRILPGGEAISAQASGGERLSSGEVSSLPLNARDFSKLLLLAAGTMTDANGAANFTQQFAVNGQRGTATVFALDGFDTTDPEMGGATFSNFNVDAIQEVQSSSGVMPAEIGHGAASFTNVVTKSGTNQVHGSFFEFARNAAFDARNYFDHKSVADERRIPPFVRNEFGFTNGGPVVLPKIYDGRDRTFYFGQYQGFRQVLGTTQVFPVPTAAERQGIDTETFPGDTLTVPVNPAIVPVLDHYPLPNDPKGAYGDRTYAASSKIYTRTDQFSVRVDHRISDKASLLTRFSLNQVTGPLTNPDQTAIDPSFAVQFFDHQRNAGVKYSRTISPHLISDTSFSYIRSTPFFPTINHTQPAMAFGDGLFQAFNAPGGSIFGSYSNLYQLKHDMSYVHSNHALQVGSGNPAQPRRHDFRDQSQRAVHVWRRHGVFSRADHFGQRHPRHSARRSAARFADRPAHGHAVFVQRHRRRGRHPHRRPVRRSRGPPRGLQLLLPGHLESAAEPDHQLRLALRSEQPHPRSRESYLASQIRRTPDGQDVPYWDHNAKQIFLLQPAASL